ILLVDYALAFRRGQGDDQAIKALQEQVKSDAQLAPKLAGEQKRVTTARRARKSRDNAIAWILILSATAFLTAAKQVVRGSLPLHVKLSKRLRENQGTHSRKSPSPAKERHGRRRPIEKSASRMKSCPTEPLSAVD